MEEIISKRIILLTNAMIVLSMIGFLELIHRVDATYKSKEYTALNMLRNCIESIPKNADSLDVSVPAAKKWLERNDPKAFNTSLDFDDVLAAQLKASGYGASLRSMKVKSGNAPVTCYTISVSPADTASCCEHGFGNLDGSKKLKHFMQQYDHLQTPVRLKITTAIAPKSIPASINMANKNARLLGDSDRVIGDSLASVIRSVRLVNDSLVIGFRNTGIFYQDAGNASIAIPAQTENVPGPTWMQLYRIDPDFRDLDKKVELQKIVRHYGDLPMDKALEMIGKDYMDAFENVDVFGFSFSTTSLPLALLAFFSFLSAGLFLMVRDAVKRKLKVISEYDNEEITDYFIKRRFIRILLWLVVPLASLAATLPVLPVENEKLLVLGTGTLLLGVMNTITLRLSQQL